MLNVNDLKGQLKYRLIRYTEKHDLSIYCLQEICFEYNGKYSTYTKI